MDLWIATKILSLKFLASIVISVQSVLHENLFRKKLENIRVYYGISVFKHIVFTMEKLYM